MQKWKSSYLPVFTRAKVSKKPCNKRSKVYKTQLVRNLDACLTMQINQL